MLNYLKHFSWLILTFGVVGFLAVASGLAGSVSPVSAALGILGLQTVTGLMVTYGFRLHKTEKISRQALLYSGWGLIGGFIVTGQILVNITGVSF